MDKKELSKKLINYILKQFDRIKDKYNLNYDNFKAFSLGYTLGIFSVLKPNKKNK